MKTRGIRNNNPLNIIRTKEKWLGMTEQQTDSRFCQFRTMAYGFRAAFLIIHSYMFKYGLVCIDQIIRRWAPPEDGNDTEAYIRCVSELSHISPQAMLHWSHSDEMILVVQAMAYVENGSLIAGDSIRNGYQMAFNDTNPNI